MRAAILCLAMVLVGGAAQADRSGARSHFLSGLELYSQGKYAAALAEYQAAWVTWEDPELLLDMAECNRHLGNLDEARDQYRGFLQRAPHSPLRGSVERQLARLDRAGADAPPPAELVAAPPAVTRAEKSHAGRAAMAIGIAGWAASALSVGIGVYTWRKYSDLENQSHVDLEALRPTPVPQQDQGFFLNPTCSPPSSLTGPAVDKYRSDCNSGQRYSDATTALWVGSAAFAVAGTVAYIVGARQASRARGLEVAPVVSLNAAALQLRFPF